MAAASFAALDATAATTDGPRASVDCANVPADKRLAAREAGLCKPATLPHYRKIDPAFARPASPTAPAATTTRPPAQPARPPAATTTTTPTRPASPPAQPAQAPPHIEDVFTTPSPVFVPPVAADPCTNLPKLPAQTLQAAYETYDARRLRISSREQHSTQRQGTILETRTQSEGRTCLVTLVVSDGQLVVVPPVVGLRTAPARSALDACGLFLDASSREDDGPAGVALAQQPEEGSVVRRGMRVRVVFSTPARVEVPPVQNLQRTDAIELLQRNGLAARIGSEDENDAAPGTVVSQDPSAGSLVPRRSEVVLAISRGRPVPDVQRPVVPTNGEEAKPAPATAEPAGEAGKGDAPTTSPKFTGNGVEDPPKTEAGATSLLTVALAAVLATLCTLGFVAGARAAVRRWRSRTGPKPPVRVEARIDPNGRIAQLDGGEAAGPLLRIEARLADARSEIRMEEEALHE